VRTPEQTSPGRSPPRVCGRGSVRGSPRRSTAKHKNMHTSLIQTIPGRARGLAPRLLLIIPFALAPSLAMACACGCGIYEVGTISDLPSSMANAEVYLDYDYQDQTTDWSGSSQAPGADNPDKNIRTGFYTFGYQQMYSSAWGLRLELPYEQRHFQTTGGATGDDIVTVNFNGIGDVRIMGMYTGFSPDMSQGVMFGLKLPSGSYTAEDAWGDVDRDSEIGTGSTDLLLGGFDRFTLGGSGWQGFAQGMLDLPVLSQAQYRPGAELDLSVGSYYTGLRLGRVAIAPLGQLKVSLRTRDTGANAADPVASGFARLFFAPGVEFDAHPFRVYADIELPLYVHVRGDQLVARDLFRLNLSCSF
jgi:hypothetical protein